MAYTQILRRIRNEKTNYAKRKNMLIGKKDFITIQISNENILDNGKEIKQDLI